MLYDLENKLDADMVRVLEHVYYAGKAQVLSADWPVCDKLVEFGLLEQVPHMFITPIRDYIVTPLGKQMVAFLVATHWHHA